MDGSHNIEQSQNQDQCLPKTMVDIAFARKQGAEEDATTLKSNIT